MVQLCKRNTIITIFVLITIKTGGKWFFKSKMLEKILSLYNFAVFGVLCLDNRDFGFGISSGLLL